MPLLLPLHHNHVFYIRVAVIQSSAYSRPDFYLASLINDCETLQSAVSLYTSIYYMYDFEVASLRPALLTSLRRGHSASYIMAVIHFFNQIQTPSQDPEKIELQPSRQIACSTAPCRATGRRAHCMSAPGSEYFSSHQPGRMCKDVVSVRSTLR